MVRRRKVEVMDGCKVCGKRMLTHGSMLIRRTCAACKAQQRRAHNRRLAARRKAERHAAKAKLALPHCQQCGSPIAGAAREQHQRLPHFARDRARRSTTRRTAKPGNDFVFAGADRPL
jgi:hypothetical protein